MKYMPSFDQVICNDLGIPAVSGLLLDLIVSAPLWAAKREHEGSDYYLLCQSKIITELPTLFGSAQAVSRAVEKLSEHLEIIRVGRSNFYRVKPEISSNWGKKNKCEGYAEYLRKRNYSENGTIPITEVYSPDNGCITVKIPPKTEAIKQPFNPLTNIQQPISAKKRFVRPIVEQIKAYCDERQNGINPQAFFDSNEAKGWKVGRTQTPMKDWQAAIRTWERNNETNSKPSKASAIDHNDTSWGDSVASEFENRSAQLR